MVVGHSWIGSEQMHREQTSTSISWEADIFLYERNIRSPHKKLLRRCSCLQLKTAWKPSLVALVASQSESLKNSLRINKTYKCCFESYFSA